MDSQAVAAPPEITSHPVRFTGDGGVYMGVWLVNLLLMVVTLGLYTPFARRRTLRYFYENTVVAGTPLEFTGGLRRMVFGFLLFFGLYIAYSIAANTEQNVAAALLIGFWALLTPLLWASATRFRLANTRWRGIRFRFNGSTREAYRESWPYVLMVAFFVAIGVAMPDGPGKPDVVRMGLAVVVALMALPASLMLLVRLEYNYARLRITRSDFGGQPGRWKVGFGPWLRMSMAAFGVFLLTAIVLGVVAALVVAGLAAGVRETMKGPQAMGAIVLASALAGFVVTYISISPALAYREARRMGLVWNTVGIGTVARFRCSLTAWPFVKLRLKNMLLSLITMGFYRPFAVTSEYRMKLESLTLHVKGDLDVLAGRLADEHGAFGDAIADAVGFDVVG